MTSRTAIGTGAVVLLIGSLIAVLLTPVFGDRGRDEIDLLTLHQIELPPGDTLTQPIRLQRPDASAIVFPYVWQGSMAARIRVALDAPDGAPIVDTTTPLPDSRLPFWEEPTSDGGTWENAHANFATIRFSSVRQPGELILHLARVDQQQGSVLLFASQLSKPSPSGQRDPRPPLVERPDDVLTVETEYGPLRPAIAKLRTYLIRLQSIAPPWLPFPLPELLFLVMVGATVFCYALVLRQSNDVFSDAGAQSG